MVFHPLPQLAHKHTLQGFVPGDCSPSAEAGRIALKYLYVNINAPVGMHLLLLAEEHCQILKPDEK